MAGGLSTVTRQTRARSGRPRWRRLALAFACASALAVPVRAGGPPGESAEPDAGGRWHPARETPERTDLSDEQRRKIEALEAIGYLAGSVAGGPGQGVAIHDRARSGAGFNFYTSGHGPEAVLMDMDGRELHRWRLPAARSLPAGAGPV